MAQNITIAGASYSDVPAVDIPKTDGGTAKFVDSSDANAVASDILSGKIAYVNGEKVTGTSVAPSGGKYIKASTVMQTNINVREYAYVNVAPTPSESKSTTTNGTVTPTSGKLLSSVTVNVPSTPTQVKSMTLGSSAPSTVAPDSGYALSSVTPSIDTSVIKAENIAQGAIILGIAGTHSGGGSQPFAFVLVNYPSGSTLTATNCNGYKDVTETQRLYYVSEPNGSTQTCVFTITDGTQTKTETVSGITIGTAQTITLKFALHIIINGVQQIGFMLVNQLITGRTTNAVQEGGALVLTTNGSASGLVTNGFDVSNYDTLYIEAEMANANSSNNSAIGFFNGYGKASGADVRNSYVAVKKILSSLARDTYAISLTDGTYNFGVFMSTISAGSNVTTKIYNAWLE